MTLKDEIYRAKEWAIEAHHGQTRNDKVTPYSSHPEAVAAAVPDDCKPAAWLHDVLENTQVSALQIKRAFSLVTYNAVMAITRRPGEPYWNYLERVKKDSIAKQVKIADIRHNLATGPTEEKAKQYRAALIRLQS